MLDENLMSLWEKEIRNVWTRFFSAININDRNFEKKNVFVSNNNKAAVVEGFILSLDCRARK